MQRWPFQLTNRWFAGGESDEATEMRRDVEFAADEAQAFYRRDGFVPYFVVFYGRDAETPMSVRWRSSDVVLNALRETAVDIAHGHDARAVTIVGVGSLRHGAHEPAPLHWSERWSAPSGTHVLFERHTSTFVSWWSTPLFRARGWRAPELVSMAPAAEAITFGGLRFFRGEGS